MNQIVFLVTGVKVKATALSPLSFILNLKIYYRLKLPKKVKHDKYLEKLN